MPTSDASYQKEYRAANPQYYATTKAQNRARGRADRALRDRHFVEWNELYVACLKTELEKENG